MKLLSLFIVSTLSLPLYANLSVQFPAQKQVEQKTLFLNGTGIRKATLLKVKVYEAGLYLPSKNAEAAQVVSMAGPKYIELSFLRSVSAAKLQNAWLEGLKRVTGQTNPFPDQLKQLNHFMEDVEKNDVLALTFHTEEVSLTLKQHKTTTIKNKAFSEALFSVWFVQPEDESLRDGLLGKKL